MLIPLMGVATYYGEEKEEKEEKKGEKEKKMKGLLEEELELVWKAMYTLPEDQSPWIYHRWLIDTANIFFILF